MYLILSGIKCQEIYVFILSFFWPILDTMLIDLSGILW